jgi:tRNA-binding protein
MSVSFETFSKLDIKVGKIVEVEDIPQARKPLYRLRVDFGPSGMKQCVAGTKSFYSREQLLGKQIVAILNLQPKPIAGVMSECMILAAFTDNQLSLLKPDKEVSLGIKVA